MSVADVVSLLNAVLGFCAILFLFSEEIRLAFSFILLAILADGLDGIIARKTRHGDLGEFLEAMADMTALGIAPAFFVYTVYYELFSADVWYYFGVGVVLVLFFSLSVIRLASFHIMKQKDFFIGLPASASTILIIILAFFEVEVLYVLIILVVISLVMVCKIRFPKLNSVVLAVATVLILLTLIFGKDYYGFAPILLFCAIFIYSVFGPILLFAKKVK